MMMSENTVSCVAEFSSSLIATTNFHGLSRQVRKLRGKDNHLINGEEIMNAICQVRKLRGKDKGVTGYPMGPWLGPNPRGRSLLGCVAVLPLIALLRGC